MIRPGAVAIALEPRADGGVDLVGEDFYCLAMFARAGRKPRPTLAALVEHAINACLDRLPALPPLGAQLELFGGYVVRAARPPSPRALRCPPRPRVRVAPRQLAWAA